MNGVVQLNHVTKTIGKKTIVDDLSFSIAKGEVFGLLGPNGAGKTTTIRMMVGLIRPTQGDVLVYGHSIQTDFQRAVAHIGAVVENPEFYRFLTGYENLLHFSRMVPGIPRERIREVARIVDLEERLRDPVKIYSLGMRQRLGIAQALVNQPQVLILDEPTNGLDPMGIKEIRDYLRGLAQREGIAVIVSSHMLSEMELLCDRVAILKGGRLLDIKDVGEIARGHAIEFLVNSPEEAEALIRSAFPQMLVWREEATLRLELEWEAIPDVVSALVNGGVKIYRIEPFQRRLEEIFMEVTGD